MDRDRISPPFLSKVATCATTALLLLLGPGYGATSQGEPDPVQLSAVMPFSGNASQIITPLRQVWELTLAEINSQGGIEGRPFVIKEVDVGATSFADVGPLMTGFQREIEEGAKYAMSLMLGSQMEALMMAPVISRDAIAISLAATYADTNQPGFDGRLFRAVYPSEQILKSAALLNQEAGRRAVAMLTNDLWGNSDNSPHGIIEKAYRDCAVCTTASVLYPFDTGVVTQELWDTLVAELMATGPSLVVLTATDAQQLRPQVLTFEASGYSGLYYFPYIETAASLLGAVSSDAFSRFRTHRLIAPDNIHQQRLLSAFEERYGLPVQPRPATLAASDALTILALGIVKATQENGSEVADAMRSVSNPPGKEYGLYDFAEAVSAIEAGEEINFQGASGAMDYTEPGDIPDGAVREFSLSTSGQLVPTL